MAAWGVLDFNQRNRNCVPWQVLFRPNLQNRTALTAVPERALCAEIKDRDLTRIPKLEVCALLLMRNFTQCVERVV